MTSCPRTIGVLSMLVAVLAVASTALGQGTIAYVRPETPISFGPLPGFDYRSVDLNGDGIKDFVIDTSSLIAVLVVGQDSNRLLGSVNWDGGVFVLPLIAGRSIPPLTPAESVWSQRGTISACAWPFGCVGPWLGQTAYVGFEFRVGESLHYGWMQIEHFESSNAGRVLDWAYETRPGVPIFAGAVPEPSTFALLIGGGLLLVWFKRKKTERRG
jgi:hypothetical protein